MPGFFPKRKSFWGTPLREEEGVGGKSRFGAKIQLRKVCVWVGARFFSQTKIVLGDTTKRRRGGRWKIAFRGQNPATESVWGPVFFPKRKSFWETPLREEEGVGGKSRFGWPQGPDLYRLLCRSAAVTWDPGCPGTGCPGTEPGITRRLSSTA